ncbi:glycogen/starch synthase [Porphyromonadaceae bacterium W3.11]|nr:glycogen/starch synthase [Porphyromonadaceae bacterium W3.11]
MSKKKVLYLAQEIYPYLEESQVGKESELVPLGIMERGNDIRTFMPNYGTINERRNQLHEVIRLSGVNLTVNDKVHQLVVKVASLMPQRMQVYFIDNEDFFGRKGVFKNPKDDTFYDDNVERSVFFIRGVFETIKKLRWIPDIIHCQGWFTGLAPLYLKTLFKDDPALSQAKIVFSTYDTTPPYPFAENLTEVLAYDGIKDPLLNGNQLDKDMLAQLILKYVDGIVVATSDASKSLMDAITTSGVAYLDYQNNEQIIESMAEFYGKLDASD